MIAYLEGLLVEVHSDRIIVDVGGVGYEVIVPYFVKRSFDQKLAQSNGAPPKVKVVTLYRVSPQNPKPELIGFETVDERIFFEKLLTVSGIGAAKAAKALVYSVSTIARFIEENDVEQLARLPGFGRRTAEKVIAELRGKVLKEALLADERFADLPSLDQEIDKEALEVLRRLGFTQVEAKAAIQAARKRSGPIESAEELVQAALRAQAQG
ncbi:MAG: Holliday junction branch migration protein RuvA [Chloroflexota bacterium]|nr:Holliday junction branch migration protein RuvA [Dehalococcoidia bacterium]MDW8254358.1 Holliday junction branch migration protein RuvA [Chloroflexota bacterium]